MRRYLLLLLLPLIFILASSKSQAQYNNAIGLRLWYWPGITFKHHISDPGALEFLLHTHWGGWVVTGLYEHHFPLGPENLNIYVGGGAHIGFWGGGGRWGNRWGPYDGGAFIGLDAIVGIEYTIPTAPINFSLDYKPAFNFAGYVGFWGDAGALSIRYTF